MTMWNPTPCQTDITRIAHKAVSVSAQPVDGLEEPEAHVTQEAVQEPVISCVYERQSSATTTTDSTTGMK